MKKWILDRTQKALMTIKTFNTNNKLKQTDK